MLVGSPSETPETSSVSSIEDSLSISFENVNYNVRSGIFNKRGPKTILDNLSGSFNAGELSVLMGQSGAGKSTLMDILAGYTKPTSGSLLVNGRPRNEKLFRRRSCYILQDDQVQEMLTIQESLTMAAEFKLGNHISTIQKHKRVEEIITSLGLGKARKTKAGSLSGGQKKRLAIGLELVSDPAVMFLDEPTSGLDSSISRQVVFLLHLLARQGRTIVVTMHQPSAALLDMVDRLYAVVGGRCAFMGSVPKLMPYLSQMELKCPPYHNPVDFLIEICSENAKELVEHSDNGKSKQWTADLLNKTEAIIYNRSISEDVYLTTLLSPKENPTNKVLLKLKSTYPNPTWKQFAILTRRALLINWRDPWTTIVTTGIHCIMALLIGILFYNIGGDAAYIRENYNFMYFSLMFLMFTSFNSVTIKFPQQIPAVRREHFNRWYTTGAFYTSTLVAALPSQMVCTLLYALIVYWMTGQPVEIIRFSFFCWTLIMVNFVALCLGLLNGSLFNIKNGVVFGPFLIMPFVVFSGFFLSYKDAPFFLRWIFHVSFLKHGLVGVVLSIIGNRPKLPCSLMYCHYAVPKQFMKDIGMTGEKYFLVVVALFATSLVLIAIAYFVLKFRLKCNWKW